MAHILRGYVGLVLIYGFLWCPAVVVAEDAELGEVTVHGDASDAGDAARDLSVAAETIRVDDYRDRVTSVAELIEMVPGVRVTRFGGLGDFATVAIRGSTAEQVQIYLDGVPLNPAAGGAVDLSKLPLSSLESITVYRGQAPIRFATSAVGGVIALTTRQAERDRKTDAQASYGSLNTFDAAASHSQGWEQTRFLINYQYGRSDGDFSFLDNNGTPANLADDQEVQRRNNEYAKHHQLTKLTQGLSDTLSLDFSNQFFREDRGMPGLGTLKSTTADLSTTRNISRVTLKASSLGRQNVNLEVAPFLSYQKSQFTDLEGRIGLGQQDNDDDTYVYGGDVITDFFLGHHQHLTFITAYRGEQFLPENFAAAPSAGTNSLRNRITVAGEDEIALWEERLIINPSVRFEMIFDKLSGDDPSLAGSIATDSDNKYPLSGKIGFILLPLEPLKLYGNFGRAYRVPNFLELFGDRGAIVGNPGLKPEKSWNFDVGVAHAMKRYRLELAYFEQRTDDLIQFLQTSQFTARAINLASATIRGAEFHASTTPWEWLELVTNYTLQWAKDTSGRAGFDGKFLPGRPKHEVHASSQFTYRWIKLFTSFDFIAENFLDSFNALKVSHRSLLGAGISITPVDWMTAGFEVKNTLNQQIEDIVGFPVPGRLYFGTVSFVI